MSTLKTIAAEEQTRDAALAGLVASVPFVSVINARFDRMGDELTARMGFAPHLVGNPILSALHGGAIGAFLETTAILQLAWDRVWRDLASGGDAAQVIIEGRYPRLPKTIDFTIDYLRSGRPRDLFARAVVTKQGRRVANVRVEGWQDVRDKPVASAHGHFLLAEDEEE
jgi:acyl-coenzyme A thioesterase PaaI-like protein